MNGGPQVQDPPSPSRCPPPSQPVNGNKSDAELGSIVFFHMQLFIHFCLFLFVLKQMEEITPSNF